MKENKESKENLMKLWKVVSNKYVAVTLIFLVLLLFLGEYNLTVSHRLSREVRQLRHRENELRQSIAHDSIMAATMQGNTEALEKFGRETYFMKAEDEDVFVVPSEED